MASRGAGLDIERLVAEHYAALYRFAYRLTGSVHDAEDLTQQAFMAAQQKLGQIRDAASVRSWLFTVLRNAFLKSCQKKQPVPAGTLQLNMETIPTDPPPQEEIDRERLQQAIGELPPGFRVVLVMFYFENLSYREIAENLDLPIGTVMSRLSRAKGHLRSKLFEPEHPPSTEETEDPASQRG